MIGERMSRLAVILSHSRRARQVYIFDFASMKSRHNSGGDECVVRIDDAKCALFIAFRDVTPLAAVIRHCQRKADDKCRTTK